MTYLNHAGTSWPKPVSVQEAVGEVLSSSTESWASRFERDHRTVCDYFGVVDPSRLLWTPGGTAALAVAISDHPWVAGDRIVISTFEHHAVHRPAQLLADRGVEVVVVPRGPGSALDLDFLNAELQRGRTRLVAMTWASNVTGELLPIADVIAVAHRHGALSLIDASQTAGWIDLDVEALGADLVAFAGHKALQGPWGIGGLYVRPNVMMSSPLASCEIVPEAEPHASERGVPRGRPCASMPGYCDVGSVNRASLAGLAAGVRWLADPARANRLDHAGRLADAVVTAAREIPGLSIHRAPGPGRTYLPTVALSASKQSPGALARRLADRGVTAGSGLQCAPLAHEALGTAPEGVLRLSFGPTSSEADAGHVLDVLRTAQ